MSYWTIKDHVIGCFNYEEVQILKYAYDNNKANKTLQGTPKIWESNCDYAQ